jgi:hypothetical protein
MVTSFHAEAAPPFTKPQPQRKPAPEGHQEERSQVGSVWPVQSGFCTACATTERKAAQSASTRSSCRIAALQLRGRARQPAQQNGCKVGQMWRMRASRAQHEQRRNCSLRAACVRGSSKPRACVGRGSGRAGGRSAASRKRPPERALARRGRCGGAARYAALRAHAACSSAPRAATRARRPRGAGRAHAPAPMQDTLPLRTRGRGARCRAARRTAPGRWRAGMGASLGIPPCQVSARHVARALFDLAADGGQLKLLCTTRAAERRACCSPLRPRGRPIKNSP